MKHMITSTFVAAFMGFVMSWLVNYFFVPVPDSVMSNAIGNGLSGMISAFMSMLMYFIMNKSARDRQ